MDPRRGWRRVVIAVLTTLAVLVFLAIAGMMVVLVVAGPD